MTSACLKKNARGIMMGKYRNAITVMLASDLIITTLSLITSTSQASYTGIIIGLIINFILTLFGCILDVGQCSFYLNIACWQDYQFSDLFTGFKLYPNKTILTQCIIRLLTLLPLVPAVILCIIMIYDNRTTLLIPACVVLIIGCIVSWWISLLYSQIYYVLLDFPQYGILELLKISRRLMKGNKGRLLYLQLSFLPITFAGLLSFGIGLLFVRPYQNMTYTLFYLDLVRQD